MTFHTQHVSADDDTRLTTYRWRAAGPAQAIVLIVHGMAEHAQRYDAFAQALADAGLDVHAFDLRGHGATTAPVDHGFLGPSADWQSLLDDVARLRTHALDTVGRLPVFLFGHSLGSFIVRATVQQRGRGYAGAILSAPDTPNRFVCRLGAAVAALEASRVDATGTSALLQRLTIGPYSRRIRKRMGRLDSPFDWLSSDSRAVATYETDPACGFALRTQTWQHVLRGIARSSAPSARRAMPAALPLLLVAGADDPMGRFGRGPRTLARALDNDGQRDVELRLYENARHELLHEPIADTVTRDIRAWIEQRLAAQPRHPRRFDDHQE